MYVGYGVALLVLTLSKTVVNLVYCFSLNPSKHNNNNDNNNEENVDVSKKCSHRLLGCFYIWNSVLAMATFTFNFIYCACVFR